MSNRGFNRGRFSGRNFWRRGFKARNTFRGRGSNTSNSRNSFTNQQDDSFDESEIDELSVPRKISAIPTQFKSNRHITSPYGGWRIYFPDDDYKKSPEIVRKVRAVEEFITRHDELFNEEEIEERRSCIFDFKMCSSDEEFLEKWPSFNEDLIDAPTTSLNCLGLGIHQTIWKSVKEQSSALIKDGGSSNIDVPLIKARISNYGIPTPLKNLKTHLYGKLVSISGTVIRVSNVKLQCSWLTFECIGCEFMQSVRQPDGIFTQPKSCLNKECKARTFKPLRSSEYTQTYDCQNVRIQEHVLDDQREGGRVPRTIECELSEDLVGSCTPGDEITIIGIVKVCSTDNNKKSNGPCMYSLYLEAVSLFNNKNMDCVDASNKSNGMIVQFTQKDYDAIQEIHSEPNLFKLLVHSLCPTIFGHEIVKAGLLLALFGGSETDTSESRAQSHVLVVGDPGLGKSQMLQACAFVAPRGVFVCGNTTTSSGLTVTLTREGGGNYALEAGALVLADQGCCCIDEFDKMSNQHQSLLEVMEQQTVSIAKAGVICMLPARTTVLAAANPAGGHYNKGKTVSENLRLGQALLSRFDLVFILLDQPNEHFDSLLSEHVMKIHSGKSTKKEENTQQLNISMHSLKSEDIKLSERLQSKPWDKFDVLPAQLLRKYIAYARKYVPRVSLSREAKKALQEFYLYLRRNHHTQDSTPVTTRQLLSLIRVTQARAKVELREEATLQDANDVIDLMRWSLIDTFSDELGTLDFQRSQHGSGLSSRSQTKRFLTALHKKCEVLSKSIFTIGEMKEIAKLVKVDVMNFSSFISTLNVQGYLLKKGRESYQVLSAD